MYSKGIWKIENFGRTSVRFRKMQILENTFLKIGKSFKKQVIHLEKFAKRKTS